MGKNIVQKIIDAHYVSGDKKAGKEVAVRIDQTLTQDATGTMAYLQFCRKGSRTPTTTCTCRRSPRSTGSSTPAPGTASATRSTSSGSGPPGRRCWAPTRTLPRAAASG